MRPGSVHRGSCALHPFPGRPAAERQPSISSGAVQNSPECEFPIEPAADENADQHGHDDDPAEHADLRQPARHRGLALAQPAPVALARAAARPSPADPVRRRASHHAKSRRPRPSGRRWRTIWRIAFSCRRVLFDMLRPLGLDIGAEAREHRLRRGSRGRRRAPPRAWRWRCPGRR